ncbi:hypothetical protein [Faecalibacter sp. LW9]|uniref:hypothetical protein n=1 Tax=Faecalibacter sp. LW9 TaxID=3103144 RepID=UPI002AFE647E|nr:hypothetical protein [Faecalibacter sp. LW9]
MDGIIFFGAIILAFLLIIVIPLAITYLLYKYLNRKFPNKLYKYIAFAPTLLLIYSIWTAIYPSEDFYKDNFKEVTQIEFPKNSKFIYKDATFPDHFGDYTSVFIIETSKNEIDKLKAQLEKLKFEEIQDDKWHSSETKSAIQKTKAKIANQYNYEIQDGKNYYVALFDDNKTVLIRRISW